MPNTFYPNRLTFNLMRQAAFEAVCYPGLDPDSKSYPGPKCPDRTMGREEAPFDDTDGPQD